MDGDQEVREGEWVVIRTPDRHEFRGVVQGTRQGLSGREEVVVRLDTGFVVSYPRTMVTRDKRR